MARVMSHLSFNPLPSEHSIQTDIANKKEFLSLRSRLDRLHLGNKNEQAHFVLLSACTIFALPKVRWVSG